MQTTIWKPSPAQIAKAAKLAAWIAKKGFIKADVETLKVGDPVWTYQCPGGEKDIMWEHVFLGKATHVQNVTDLTGWVKLRYSDHPESVGSNCKTTLYVKA